LPRPTRAEQAALDRVMAAFGQLFDGEMPDEVRRRVHALAVDARRRVGASATLMIQDVALCLLQFGDECSAHAAYDRAAGV
jgi:hypothetical protein